MSTSDAAYQLFLARTHAPSAKSVTTPTKKKSGKVPHTPVTADGYTFPSGAEYRRYLELKWLEKAGVIRDLRIHTEFPLEVNGEVIGTYTDDADYWTTGLHYVAGRKRLGAIQQWVVEDVKGRHAKSDKWFQRVKKLMKACHGVTISEVYHK